MSCSFPQSVTTLVATMLSSSLTSFFSLYSPHLSTQAPWWITPRHASGKRQGRCRALCGIARSPAWPNRPQCHLPSTPASASLTVQQHPPGRLAEHHRKLSLIPCPQITHIARVMRIIHLPFPCLSPRGFHKAYCNTENPPREVYCA